MISDKSRRIIYMNNDIAQCWYLISRRMIWAAAARGGRVFTGEELMLCKQIQYKHKYCYCKQLQHKYKYNMSNENGTALQKWKWWTWRRLCSLCLWQDLKILTLYKPNSMLPCLFDKDTKYKYKSYQVHVNTQIQLKNNISINIKAAAAAVAHARISGRWGLRQCRWVAFLFSYKVYFFSLIKCIYSFLLNRLL